MKINVFETVETPYMRELIGPLGKLEIVCIKGCSVGKSSSLPLDKNLKLRNDSFLEGEARHLGMVNVADLGKRR